MPKVSIIMAAYNAAPGLERALKSIQSQSLSDWELIVIDDGSTDDTPAILDRYAGADSRINVIHRENGGVATARQWGIDRATGDYSIHIDADDWIECDMLQEMYANAIAESADMVIADFYINKTDGTQILRTQELVSNKPDDILYQLHSNRLFGGLCHKLIRTDIYSKFQITFDPEINYCEDKLVVTKILTKNPTLKVSYLPKAFYHYVQSDTSITGNVTPKAFESIKRYQQAYKEFLPKQDRFLDVEKQEQLNLFLTGFIYKLYDNQELAREFPIVRRQAYRNRSLRWLTGYLLIDLRLYNLARKFIKY